MADVPRNIQAPSQIIHDVPRNIRDVRQLIHQERQFMQEAPQVMQAAWQNLHASWQRKQPRPRRADALTGMRKDAAGSAIRPGGHQGKTRSANPPRWQTPWKMRAFGVCPVAGGDARRSMPSRAAHSLRIAASICSRVPLTSVEKKRADSGTFA